MANVRRNYIDRHRVGSFSGLPKFADSKKNLGSEKEIKKQLEAIDAYTLHRPVRNHPPSRKTLVFFPYQTFGIDLIDTQRLAKLSNSKVKFILLAVDNFSRLAFSTFLGSKDAKTVLAGLKRIFKQSGKFPKFVLADQGTEFYNSTVKNYFAEKNIKLYSVHTTNKSSMCERVIQTLRRMLGRAQTQGNTKKFEELWPSLVRNYNASRHSVLKMAPRDVEKNPVEAFHNIYGKMLGKKPKKLKFQKGDLVRISKARLQFEKRSQTQSYSKEIFRVTRAIPSYPVNYFFIESLSPRERIQGSFLTEELIPVRAPGNGK